MEEETLFLFVPYSIKNRDEERRIRVIKDGQAYLYNINRVCVKKADTGEKFKRTPVYFEPIIGETCYVIKILNSGKNNKDGLCESVYFPYIFNSLEDAIKERDEIQKGEYSKHLHSKEKFVNAEILTLKITEY